MDATGPLGIEAYPTALGDWNLASCTIDFIVPVPSGTTTALAANVTVTQPTANGFLGVFPPSSGLPNSSVLSFLTGQQTQNAITVGVGSSPFGDFDLYNASKGSTQLIVDVYGYYNS